MEISLKFQLVSDPIFDQFLIRDRPQGIRGGAVRLGGEISLKFLLCKSNMGHALEKLQPTRVSILLEYTREQ